MRRGGGWRGWGAEGATSRRRRRWRTEQAKLARTTHDLAALLLIPANGETPFLFEIHRANDPGEGLRFGLPGNFRAQVAAPGEARLCAILTKDERNERAKRFVWNNVK